MLKIMLAYIIYQGLYDRNSMGKESSIKKWVGSRSAQPYNYALANNIHCLKKGTLDPLPSIFCHLWDSCSRSVLGSR